MFYRLRVRRAHSHLFKQRCLRSRSEKRNIFINLMLMIVMTKTTKRKRKANDQCRHYSPRAVQKWTDASSTRSAKAKVVLLR